MPNSNHADFTPEKPVYVQTGSFKYWVQKVLPTLYDDSLSYYELLSRILNNLNDVVKNVDSLHDGIDNTIDAFDELQNYVNSYFDDLDAQQIINDKLDEMAEDGTLTELVEPFLPDIIANWLSTHITPTTPVIDRSLTISGAGADAKVVGDFLEGVLAGSGIALADSSFTNLDDIDMHRVYYWNAVITSSQISNAPEYGKAAIVFTNCYKKDNYTNGAVQWFITIDGSNHVYIRGNANLVWREWSRIDSDRPGILRGSGIFVTDSGVNSLNDLPANNVYYFGTGITSSQIANAPEYGKSAIVWSNSYKKDDNINGSVQWFVTVDGTNHVYIRGNANYIWGEWSRIDSYRPGVMKGSGIFITESGVNSLNDLPAHNVYYFGTGVTSEQVSNAPEYGKSAVVWTNSYKKDESSNGSVQWFVTVDGSNHVYVRGNANFIWGEWKRLDVNDENFISSTSTGLATTSYSSLFDIPVNKIFYWNGGLDAETINDAPVYGNPAIVLWTAFQKDGGKNAAIQWFITEQTNEIYFRNNFNNTLGKWQRINIWDYDEEYKIFAKVAVVGDSLATGWCYVDGVDTERRRRNIEFCWPTYVGRDARTEWFNVGQSGYTTRTFLSGAEGYGLPYAQVLGRKAQAYVIALGVNDKVESVPIGSISDIDTSNQRNNADTFYGNYSRIIWEMRQINPECKVFCFTRPAGTDADVPYNTAIKDVVETIWSDSGVYVVDLADNAFSQLYKVYKTITYDYSNSHYAPIAYQCMARIIERSISEVMRANQEDFRNVPYIPYDKVGDPISVSGTSVSITALRDMRYICGTLDSLTITPCSIGTFDVIFTSGSTATVLTLPGTVKMPSNWSGVGTSKTYRLRITDGEYADVTEWN